MKSGKNTIRDVFKTMRPGEYAKNLIIFTPSFFAGSILEPGQFFDSVLAFIVFCLAASAVYTLNDLLDAENDKKHPAKKYRPLASGLLSLKTAVIMITVLVMSSSLIALMINPAVFLIILGYMLLNAGYSYGLKNIPIIDLIIVSSGFVLRLLAGGAATGVELTFWIISLTFLLALVLVGSRRYHDLTYLKDAGISLRPVISKYSPGVIYGIVIASSVLTVLIYFLWSFYSDSFSRSEPDILFLTTIFVGLGFFRFLELMFSADHAGNPMKVFYTDRPIQIVILAWLIFVIWYFYLN